MSKTLQAVLFSIIINITFFFSIAAHSSEADIRKVDLENLFSELQDSGSFNGAVLVAQNGKIIFKNTSGYAFKEKGVFIIDSSSFELGSVSKTFTALSLHMLSEKGQLDLNAPITDHFPNLPYPEVTIKALLSHTSGLYDVYEEKTLRDKFFAFYNNVNVPYSNQDYFDFITLEKPPLLWQPGEKHKYSNTAYVILGLLIEKISGQSYYDFISDNILKPAGMSETYLLKNLKGERVPSLVYGYRKNDDGQIVRNPDPEAAPRMRGMTYGDDDLISTLSDMYKYDQAIRNGVFLKSDKLDQILEPVLLNDGTYSQYAYGFKVRQIDSSLIVEHTGSTSGFYAYSKFSHPSSDYSITLFLNVTMGGENFRKLQKSINDIMQKNN